jgi:hypothetical protein
MYFERLGEEVGKSGSILRCFVFILLIIMYLRDKLGALRGVLAGV